MREIGIQWHITDACNLRCAHCYQSDFTPAAELPADRLQEIADRIFGSSPDARFFLNVTGGEPFLHRGFSGLIGRLGGLGNIAELNVITNGTLVRDEPLAALRECSIPGAFKISVESHDVEVNDRTRGKGALARVVANLPALMERTGRCAILMATLARYNADHVAGLVDLARRVGADGVIFERFVPLGVGAASAGEILRTEDWRRAVEDIVAAAGIDVPFEDVSGYAAFQVMTDFREDALKGAACELGGGSMALMPDGTVHPCRRLPVPVGNVLDEPFDAILDRLEEWRPLEGGDPLHLGCRAIERTIRKWE